MTTKELLIFCFLAGVITFYKVVGGRSANGKTNN